MKQTASAPWIRPVILIFAAVAPVWTLVWLSTDWMIALSPLFASHMLLLYPTLVAQSQWWGPVIRQFETSRQEVWITIDDGPTPAHTEKILDILDRYRARATFFVVGSRAGNAPHLIEEILRRGHTIANHTFTHASGSFWYAGPRRIANEIDRSAKMIGENSNPPDLFRAPAGLKNFFLHPALACRGMLLIGWTLRGMDTWRRDPAVIATAINRRVRPGAIILLHEGHHVGKAPELNPRCVELTLQALASSGYQFVIPAVEQLRTNFVGR